MWILHQSSLYYYNIVTGGILNPKASLGEDRYCFLSGAFYPQGHILIVFD